MQRLAAARAILVQIDLSSEIPEQFRPELRELIMSASALASSPIDKESEFLAQRLIARLHWYYSRLRTSKRY